jgi:peptidoglycan/LPS O-acetylase OafA/YrhL
VERWRLGYRPALDGLRGIAVLLVMAGHFEVVGFRRGGIVGVTIFFALSGFLITALLAEEHERSGRARLGRFYLRRAYRLLPALVVFVAAASLYEAARGATDHLVRNAGASLFYVANWVAIDAGGFGKFGHVWSLSVEEQFYLLWPAVLLATLAVVKDTRRAAFVALAGAVACGAVRLALAESGSSFDRILFGTDTRGDALLLGCFIALLFVSGTRWLAMPSAAVGAALVVFALVSTLDSTTKLAVLLAVMAVGSALLVAGLASAPRWPVLELPALVWVGRISYGLYLWHFLFTTVAKQGDGIVRVASVTAAAALTFAAAALSYRFVERPFLVRKQRLAEAGTVSAPT